MIDFYHSLTHNEIKFVAAPFSFLISIFIILHLISIKLINKITVYFAISPYKPRER